MTAPTLPPPARPRTASGAATWPRRAVAGVRSLSTRTRRDGIGGMPAWLVGPLAALWAAVIGFGLAALPMLVVWMATPSSGLTWLESLRDAGLLWVVAHGAPVVIAGVTYSLLPWGLVVIPLLLLGCAGGWAARRGEVAHPRDLLILVIGGAATYALVVGAAAVAIDTAASSVSVVHAIGYALVLALLGLGWGAYRADRLGVGAAPVPAWLAVVLRSGVAAAVALIGIGAVAATLSLLVHVDDAITMWQSLHAGVWGGLALLGLGLAYAPVLAVWGAAYVMGAGVIIGPAVTVSPFIAVTAPTQLPPFPLLAALPQAASPMAWALPLAGILAGVVAGLMIGRRARQEPRLVRLAMAAGSAAVAGLLLAIVAALASGSLGDLRLAHVGPSALTVGVLAAVLVALGAAPSAVVPSPPDRPRLSVADPSATDASPVDHNRTDMHDTAAGDVDTTL